MFDHFSQEAIQLLLGALDRDQPPFVTIRSDSMAPLLRRGDQIQLGPIALEHLTIGDIIVLGESKELFAHRFWGVREKDEHVFLISRGDRLAYYDALTPSPQLRAIVIARRRSGRIVNLTRGSGNWLNRTLTRLSGIEAQIMRLPPPTSVDTPGPTARYGFARRLARRTLLALATLLTAAISRLPD